MKVIAPSRSPRPLKTSIAALLPIVTLFVAIPGVQADVTKANNTTNLNVAGSYTPSGLPLTTDKIIVDNTISTVTNSAASLGGDMSVAGLVFSATTAFTNSNLGNGSYFIANTSGTTLTLGSSGIVQNSASGANLAINSAVALSASQAFDVGTSGRTLTIDGTRGGSLFLGSNVLTVQGAGNTILSGVVNGTGSITKTGAGTLTLNFSGGSFSTNAGSAFSGGITSSGAGTLAISAVNAAGSGLITTSSTLNISQAQLLLSGGITINGGTTTLSNTTTAGTGKLTLNTGGTLTMSSTNAAQLALVVLNGGTFTTPGIALAIGSLAGTQGFTNGAFSQTFGTNNTFGTYSGNIAGAVAANVIKQGTGTQKLNGTNATTGTITANGSGGTLEIGGVWNGNGAVAVNSGGLKLNFGTGNSSTTDLIKSAALTLGGGSLAVVGRTDATNAIQNFTSTSTTAGTGSMVSATNGAGGGTTAVNIGAITRGAGSAINFALPSGTQSSTNSILTSTGTASSLLAPAAGTAAFATVNGTDFAAKDSSNAFVQALTGSVTATGGATLTATATDNADITGGNIAVSGASAINTVRFNDSAARTLTLSGAITISSGGILVSNAVTTAGSKITGSTITSGATLAELIIHQYSAQPFTLDSQVTGTTALVKAGPGTLIITKANTNFASNIAAYVASGTLQIGSGGSFANGVVSLAPNDPSAVFDVNNQTTTVGNLAGGGNTGGYVNLGATGVLNIAGNFGQTFNGALVGGVDSVINKSGGSNTQGFNSSSNIAFYGTLNVANSAVGFFTNTPSLINGNINLNTGGVLNPGSSAGTVSVGDISGSGSIIGASIISTAQTYQIGYLGGTKTFSGVISNGTNATPGLTGLIKFGSGTTTLSGVNTFTGGIQLNSGGLIFDYSPGTTTLATTLPITVGGGTATFKGKASGTTSISTGTFGFNNSVLSKVTVDANAGSGTTLSLQTTTVNSIVTLGSTASTNSILFDTSSSASNVLQTSAAIGASDNTNATVAIRTQNGLLTTGNGNVTTPTFNNYRANILIKDSTGIGFATTSGTSIVRYTGATVLTGADTTTVLSETGTGNYILSTNLTRGASNQFLYNTLQLDSSTQAVTLTTDANGNRFGSGSGSTSGRGVLATGTNGATITSPGGTNQATYFYNYQNGGTTAGQTLTLNMNLAGSAFFNGTGLIVATGNVNSSDQWFQSGVTRLTGAQGSGDSLTAGNGVYRLVGGVLEIGADLTGSTSASSTADFSRSVGGNAGQVQLLGDTGFSAYTGTVNGTRTVNLGGVGQTLLWGQDNFMTSTAGTTTEGNNTFKLSSVYADSTVDFQNGIALGSITRNVDVANGAATIDAKLSGVISGVFGPTAMLANSAPAIANAAAGLTKLGAGNLALTAANTYNGPTTVVAGTLQLSNALALQNSTLVPRTSGVVFDSSVTANSNAFTVGGLSGVASGNDLVLQNNAVSPAAIALTIGNNNKSETYAGTLSGTGSLTKIGTGTQTLSGSNTFIGATAVSNGTLAASVANALQSTSSVTINSGGTLLLAGSGSINRINDSAAVTLADGTLSASSLSNSSETFGALTLSGNSTIDFGTGNGNTLTFASLSDFTGTLTINGWSGSFYSVSATNDPNTDTTQDRLVFTADPTLTTTQLSNISFYSDSGSFIGNGLQVGLGSAFEVVPVPEPSTWVGAGLDHRPGRLEPAETFL